MLLDVFASLVRRFGPFRSALVVTVVATILSALITTVTMTVMGLGLFPALFLAVFTPLGLALPVTYLAFLAIEKVDRAQQLQEKRETELEESQSRLKGYLELASDWTWELDKNLRFRPSDKVTRQRLLSRASLDFDLVVGRTRWEHAGIPDPENDAIWASHVADLAARREFLDFRYNFVAADGRTRHVKVSGRPRFNEVGQFKGYIGVGTDETEQVEARLRAEQAEAQLRSAIESIPNPLLLLDAEDRVSMFNMAWREYYPDLAHAISPGTSFEDLAAYFLNSGLWDPMGPPDVVLEDRLRRHHEPSGSFEQQLSDGRFILISENRAEDGWRIITQTDVTEFKRIDRLKDEFISMVSHELRTPLTSIKGSLDLLSAGVVEDRPADVTRLVDMAKRNTYRLLLIVNDILDAQKIETVPLMPILEKSLAANEAVGSDRGIKFRLDSLKTDTKVQVDAQRLDQVLTNLLSNAAKFAPRGSTVGISVIRDNGFVRVAVHDEGPGIPDEIQERVFERFWQADASTLPEVSGTGLGLSIAKKIIEAMGGTIGFESRYGDGCTFYFDLPEACKDESRALSPSSA